APADRVGADQRHRDRRATDPGDGREMQPPTIAGSDDLAAVVLSVGADSFGCESHAPSYSPRGRYDTGADMAPSRSDPVEAGRNSLAEPLGGQNLAIEPQLPFEGRVPGQ